MASEGEDAAQKVAISLVKQFPQEKKVRDVAENHLRRIISRLQSAGQYEEALAAVERHGELLSQLEDPKLSGELTASVYDSSARVHMAAKNWAQAVDVYEKGLKHVPNASLLETNFIYCCQEWLRDALEQEGEAGAQNVAIDLLKRFPENKDLRKLVENHLQRVAVRLCDDEKFADAIACVDRHKDLLAALGNSDVADDVLETVYDRWARTYFKKDWAKAIETYELGLKRVPKSALLKNNLKYSQQEAKK
jgi:tetratricopeptide (TPR) repeat protein